MTITQCDAIEKPVSVASQGSTPEELQDSRSICVLAIREILSKAFA